MTMFRVHVVGASVPHVDKKAGSSTEAQSLAMKELKAQGEQNVRVKKVKVVRG